MPWLTVFCSESLFLCQWVHFLFYQFQCIWLYVEVFNPFGAVLCGVIDKALFAFFSMQPSNLTSTIYWRYILLLSQNQISICKWIYVRVFILILLSSSISFSNARKFYNTGLSLVWLELPQYICLRLLWRVLFSGFLSQSLSHLITGSPGSWSLWVNSVTSYFSETVCEL